MKKYLYYLVIDIKCNFFKKKIYLLFHFKKKLFSKMTIYYNHQPIKEIFDNKLF